MSRNINVPNTLDLYNEANKLNEISNKARLVYLIKKISDFLINLQLSENKDILNNFIRFLYIS